MKYIITEDQYHKLYVLRRTDVIWEHIVKTTYPYMYPCDYHRENYIRSVINAIGDLSDDSLMDKENVLFIRELVEKYFSEEILNHWDKKCG